MTNNTQGGHPSYNIGDKLYVLKWKSDSLTHKIPELVKISLDTHKSNLSIADSAIKGFNVTEFNIQSMTMYALLDYLYHVAECVCHLDCLHFHKERDP
jgi:hypothetical protein